MGLRPSLKSGAAAFDFLSGEKTDKMVKEGEKKKDTRGEQESDEVQRGKHLATHTHTGPYLSVLVADCTLHFDRIAPPTLLPSSDTCRGGALSEQVYTKANK